jgi:hypothetical protein
MRCLVLGILEHRKGLRPQNRPFLGNREIDGRVFLGQPCRHKFAAADYDIHLAGGQCSLAGDDLPDQLGICLHLQEHILDGWEIGLRQLRRFLADASAAMPITGR